MQVIAMLGQKGGGGKTTIGTGLAVEAAKRGKATLVIGVNREIGKNRTVSPADRL